MEEFIAAALDQRKVLNAKNINTIFGEGPIFNHWNERKLGSVHRLDQRMWSAPGCLCALWGAAAG